jgi:putative transposase
MCTEDRHKCFSDLEFGRRACTQLLRTAADWWVEVIAYCFMPDHLHVLVEAKSEDANSRKWADIFRQVSGFHFRRERGHRLWQDGDYDHILRKEDDVRAVAKYIVLNPVRAGLCTASSEYRLLGSSRYALPELIAAADWYPPSLG